MDNIDKVNLSSQPSLESLQKQIEDQEFVYKNILEGTMAGYWDWQIPDDYEYLSPTFKSMFGYEDHEMKNHPSAWQEIIFQEDLPKLFESFEEHVKTRGATPFRAEARYKHKTGSTVWVYCRGKVIEWDENGAPVRAVGSHIDITKLKNAEENEKRYSRELEIKNRELERFAFAASHDLKEPIRTINSFSSLLKNDYKGKLDDRADEFLEFIVDSSKRMNSLVNDLLEYCTLGHSIQLSEINTNKIIEEIRNDLHSSIDESNAKFEIETLENINGSETEIRLLFQNLISNALKFKKESVNPHIKISSETKEEFIHFTLSDNGIGISEESLESIFDIFQRLHDKSEYVGTGIGLANCKKIVEIHGGKIWVESKLGEGSSFYFTIRK